jgi:hypothetical protein
MRQPAAGGAYTLASTTRHYKKGANSECFHLPECIISVVEGDKVFISAANNSGAAIALTPSIAASASCWAIFEMVGD